MSSQRKGRKFRFALFMATSRPSGNSGPSGDDATSRPSVPSAPRDPVGTLSCRIAPARDPPRVRRDPRATCECPWLRPRSSRIPARRPRQWPRFRRRHQMRRTADRRSRPRDLFRRQPVDRVKCGTAWRLPYTLDLVRLATSATLATRHNGFSTPARDLCDAILEGYTRALERCQQAL